MKPGLHPNTRSTLGETLPTAGRRGNDILERARGLVPQGLLTTDCGRPRSEMWWRTTDNADNRHPPDDRAAVNIDLAECRLRVLPTTTTPRTPVIAVTTTKNTTVIELIPAQQPIEIFYLVRPQLLSASDASRRSTTGDRRPTRLDGGSVRSRGVVDSPCHDTSSTFRFSDYKTIILWWVIPIIIYYTYDLRA